MLHTHGACIYVRVCIQRIHMHTRMVLHHSSDAMQCNHVQWGLADVIIYVAVVSIAIRHKGALSNQPVGFQQCTVQYSILAYSQMKFVQTVQEGFRAIYNI